MIDGAEEGCEDGLDDGFHAGNVEGSIDSIIDGLKVNASDGGDEGSLLGWMRALQKVFYSVSCWEFLLLC